MISVIISLAILLSQAGYSEAQILCTANLVQKESNYNLHSRNSKTGAYGLFQLMRVDKKLTLKQQTDRYIKYINHRYKGDACLAWKHFQKNNWY